ncbi:unnamed protein product [Pseudo-nitzschia multistriata]|uniref:Leucine-binding protein domain-containing protein n=1 Tax=Pseudo-nitzschia multistriata TaxID=183589 RepID=A0A448Z010_9STRA|nr:unnamed protein product [Pseudo-nitzschia multistriata]
MPSQSHRSPSRMWRGMPWGVKATIQLLSILFVCMVDAAALEDSDGVVSLYRTIEEGTDCDFAGTMVIGNFFSLGPDDKFFALGSGQRTAFNIMIDHINRHKCGVRLDGLDGNYAIELRTYDDLGSTDGSSAVAYKLANDSSVDVLTAGYSSTLTQPYVEIAHNESDKLVLAPGAASTKVFLDKPLAFGMLPPTQKYLLQAVKALATISGAKTMATVWEDASFTRGVCAAAPGLAEQYGMTMTSMTEVVNTPNVTVLEPIAATLQAENPDVVITCVYDCAPWVRAMRKVGWSPKAQVFTVCVGQEKFSNEIGTDTAYLMGVTPWDASLQIEDAVTGWTPSEFASLYRTVLGEEETADVAYQSAMAGALISVLYQAVEAVGSFQDNGPELAEYISNNSFETMGGNFSFDENGQSMAPSLMVQYDAEQLVHTIYPLETASGPILYPMPSWDHRDCTLLSTCEQQADNITDYLPMGNVCNDEGICVCVRVSFRWVSKLRTEKTPTT